ncbi:type VI secretion system protein TssA [Ottowia caeni]|uniref:type VI secretion system protein TssA n=1 Tax=Ottowia caeni TaxID=2870339 RepID=UPI001E28C79D|nr:type VI secretion system protein TssA [Ottowia caeni]
MLTAQVVEDLLKPVSEDLPCGPDLEYDPEFLALQTEIQGKPEQQFGDTVIAAVEPDWRKVRSQSLALLARSKDLRPALLLLRACTRLDGLPGFHMGAQLLSQLLDTYWPTLYPQLDAEDDDDPTMRLNALAPLVDESSLLRDLYDVAIGVAPGLGPVRVRDVLTARNALASVGGSETMPQAAVEGGLLEIVRSGGESVEAIRAMPELVVQLGTLINDRTGRADAMDLSRLRAIAQHLHHALMAAGGGESAAAVEDESGASPVAAGAVPASVGSGEIRSRQDAIQTLNRVIHYLEQAEPGNPAPLLIERAKKLIGVSFLDIMANLAPNALDTIEVVTGKRDQD